MSYSFRDPNEDVLLFKFYKLNIKLIINKAITFFFQPDDPNAIGPMMVPVGDILNHIAKNNAHLRFEENDLLICSIKEIKKDEEVFNTYGEHSNCDLLHMYGFVEVYPHNTFDTVEIPTKLFFEAFKKQKLDPIEVVNKKIETMLEMELIKNL